MLQPTFTHTQAGQEGGAAPHFGPNNNVAMQQVSLFTGGRITAAEAYRLGAVERLVPPKKLFKEARAFAGLIAAKSRRALVLAKEALNGLEARDVARGDRFEQGFTLEMYLHEASRKTRQGKRTS